MNDRKPSVPDSARDGAIDWWLRKNNGPLCKKEQAELEAWLASDEANKAAFEKISNITGTIAAHGPGTKPGPKSGGRA